MTGANLVQSQAMKLSLSAGMRQSLQVLQCSSEELTSLIYEQLWNNPMLEEAAGGNDLSGFDGYFDRRDPGGRTRTAGFEEWGAQAGPGDSLEAVLTEQLNFSVDRRSVLYRAAAFIIGNLTDAGYLTMTVADMAHALRMPETEVEKALVAVRSFEPAGVGAYGLRDCLLLQLGRLEQRNELAERLVESCLTDLSEGNIGKIAAKLKAPAERLRDAIRLVRGWIPAPEPGLRGSGRLISFPTPSLFGGRRDMPFISMPGLIPGSSSRTATPPCCGRTAFPVRYEPICRSADGPPRNLSGASNSGNKPFFASSERLSCGRRNFWAGAPVI
ncbi:hypothetical protein JW799_01150 [Cohnella algarum]|nr:hypothetical protein [Cohnella algarum]MBN2979973.1 hypothetical protein [Cohnella algarum]